MTGLLLGLQLSAFSLPLLAAAPDADAAVAVAVGLARAEDASIEVPVSVEVAKPKPPARANQASPEGDPIEWVRTCDQYGCRLVPRVPSPAMAQPSPAANRDPAPAAATRGEEECSNPAEGCRWRARRLLFGRRR